jgi:hypothetical protein
MGAVRIVEMLFCTSLLCVAGGCTIQLSSTCTAPPRVTCPAPRHAFSFAFEDNVMSCFRAFAFQMQLVPLRRGGGGGAAGAVAAPAQGAQHLQVVVGALFTHVILQLKRHSIDDSGMVHVTNLHPGVE